MLDNAKKISNISAVAMIVFTIVSIIAQIIHNIVIPNDEFRDILDYIFRTIEYIVKTLIVYFIFVLLCNRKKIKPEKLEPKVNDFTTVIMIIWASSALILLGGAYSIFLTGPADVIPLAKGMTPMEHIVIIIVYVIFPAIFDEIVYRGLFAREYRVFGIAPMFMFSSLVYALSKLSMTEFPYLFICGLFFCFVYYFSGSITAVIITHLIYSSLSYCIKLLQVSNNLYMYRQTIGIVYIILGVIFVASIIMFITKAKRIKLDDREHLESFRFFTPLMLIFLGLSFVVTIVIGNL